VPERPRYIVVEGPTGVGKTALARILGDRLQARLVLERAEDNPFMREFCREPKRYAFQMQLFSLLGRYQQQDALGQEDLFARGGLVSDFMIARDRILATVNLTPAELALHEKIYAILCPRVPRPDLVVYLQARTEVLLARLRKRAQETKDGEVFNPPAEYVEEVARAYRYFFFHYGDGPLLVVNTSEIDFVASAKDRDDLVAVIRKTRAGTQHYIPLAAR
jgi:deoxyadenosine/deoxycytidine kinase